MAWKDGNRVELITRSGYDFADRYPLIVDGIASLPVKTCIIDGEAIVVDPNGLSVFNLLRYRQHDHATSLNSMVRTCGQALSRNASSILLGHCANGTTGSRSTRPMTATAR